MVAHANVLSYFWQAGPVVKCVMLLLGVASLISWTFIIQRAWYLADKQRQAKRFRDTFWSSKDVSKIFADIAAGRIKNEGLASVFYAGYKSYTHYRKSDFIPLDAIERVMQSALAKESQKLSQHLPFFASVGSIAPYVGLFGTVWGIVTSFQALGDARQATIAMVAPGISEALVATALGLFTAIPAVMAYNRYTHKVNQLMDEADVFQNEFISIIEQNKHTADKGAS